MYVPANKPKRNVRRGAVLVLAAISLTVLLGVVAIVLDGGKLQHDRRHTQITADASALAAAGDLYTNYTLYQGKDTLGTAKQAALDLAKANGYNNDGTTSVVTVNIPPTSGTFSGIAGYAEVIIQYNQKRGFSAIFGSGDLVASARGVARGLDVSVKSGLILLNPSKAAAFHMNGNPNVTVKDASVYVNSKAAGAAKFEGNAKLSADSLEIAGKYEKSGPVTLPKEINTGVSPTPDPLAHLPVPNSADYTVRSTSTRTLEADIPVVLQPGIYKGGIRIRGNAVVTMQPGVYLMEGGGFEVTGNGIVTGTETMIYNQSGSGGGKVHIAGNGKVTLTPPTTGAYQGVGLFQERTMTDTMYIAGNGNMQITGVIYAKAAHAQIVGNGTLGADTLGGSYVSDTMQVSGNGGFTINMSTNNLPSTRKYGLVE